MASRREDVLQLGQGGGQGGGKPGRLAVGEAHRPAPVVGDDGAGAAGLGVAALGVPALGYRLGALVGDEVVIDVVHVQARGVGGQHRRAELALQRERVAGIGDRRKPGPQRAQAGEPADPGEDPGLGGDQVLGPLGRGHPERERQ